MRQCAHAALQLIQAVMLWMGRGCTFDGHITLASLAPRYPACCLSPPGVQNRPPLPLCCSISRNGLCHIYRSIYRPIMPVCRFSEKYT